MAIRGKRSTASERSTASKRSTASERSTASKRGKSGLTFDAVREMALTLPGMEEATSYGTPSFKVNKKFIARLHPDGESLVLKVDPEAREVLTRADPETFFFTEHYAGYPEYLLVRLSKVRREMLAKLLEEAWKKSASRRHLEAREKPAG
ncbi:MmcQ/YjbR family DNA-binding protein [Pyxidicoccus parkwayensis]|uniref:MmcQ/YjbR family DNA-binding protein n=1 Tax=Pyxidicoccus parkwayensis TaxID=2813578 RepID=A0ABX7P9T5_9BACT|nr:MmcQ/YjbR family DNA-binding protein [Pyxidicoccus parkwaysis]QSQ27259.1 MmcQ/YjbR family DNA-binding protein [Pyxidicoccus parkwaysis]